MIGFDHTIVPSTDRDRSANFFADIFGLTPRSEDPFIAVDFGNDVSLYFAGWDQVVGPQHYAFRVDETGFDAILQRLQAACLTYWADSSATLAGQINRNDGGRGLYFRAPDDHFVEVITRRYGSGGDLSPGSGT